MDEEDGNVTEESRAEDDDVSQEEGYSDDSDESDDTVDPAVAEDIARFQETFKGITERFRLINRIGEGNYKKMNFAVHSLTRHRYILYCLQSRGPALRTLQQRLGS
jgi:cell division control protein 7